MRPSYEVADIISLHRPQLKGHLSAHQLRTLSALERCRTEGLGSHVDGCDVCGYLQISYNSCRNRHCPKCQGLNKEMWIIQQEDMLLPVAYFHVVFTLPHELNGLCQYNPKWMYGLLFKAAWYTINTLAKDPKWIGAQTAATMVLHTWSQTMCLHPHVHCIVPNGGLTKEDQWQYPRRGTGNLLFPVAAMKRLNRGYLMAQINLAIKQKLLRLSPNFPKGKNYKAWKDNLYEKEWVVYTKKPFSGVKQVVNYLARYSHRVAITNHRIQSIEDGKVQFNYKDYREGAKRKTMCLQGQEFLRRFCQHILPQGFRKVRQYGFLSNASKAKSLALARKALGQKEKQLLSKAERKDLAIKRLFKERARKCPCCEVGILKPLHELLSNKDPPASLIPLR